MSTNKKSAQLRSLVSVGSVVVLMPIFDANYTDDEFALDFSVLVLLTEHPEISYAEAHKRVVVELREIYMTQKEREERLNARYDALLYAATQLETCAIGMSAIAGDERTKVAKALRAQAARVPVTKHLTLVRPLK